MVLLGKSIDGLVKDTGAERISTQGDPRDRGGQEVPRQGGDWAAEGGYCIVGSRIDRNGDLMVAGGGCQQYNIIAKASRITEYHFELNSQIPLGDLISNQAARNRSNHCAACQSLISHMAPGVGNTVSMGPEINRIALFVSMLDQRSPISA